MAYIFANNIIDETAAASMSRDYAPENVRLANVFKAIQENHFTLRSFLLKAFRSGDSKVRFFVGMFIAQDGPAVLINEWAGKVENTKNDETFTEAVTDVVIGRARKDLRRVNNGGSLQTSARSVTHAHVEGFSLDPIEEELNSSAPCLIRLLRGLAYKEKKLRKNKAMKSIEKREKGKEKEQEKEQEKEEEEEEEGCDDLPYHPRELTTIVSTIASMLVVRQSQQSNRLQMIFGLYFAATRCPKRVVNVLASIGLCVSPMTTHNALTQLSNDMLSRVREAVRNHPFSILYDNINIANRKYDQRTYNGDTFENGTTATIVIGEDLGTPTSAQSLLRPPQLSDFLPDQQNRSHMKLVYTFHLFDMLQRHYSTYERCSIHVPELEILPTRQTLTFPLPAMRHDQSTNEGNLDVLQDITQIMLKLPEDWFNSNTRIIVSGDQLTVSRVISLQELRAADTTPFNRLEWAVPVMQLFHLQMLFCSTILRTHYGRISEPGSLAFFITMLGRKRVNLDSPNYHAADEVLRHIFDAMVRRVYEVELNVQRPDAKKPDAEKPDAQKPEVLDDEILDIDMLNDEVLDDRILNTQKLETFGTSYEAPLGNAALDKRVREATEAICHQYLTDPMENPRKFGNANANAALFLRDMMVYMELGAAIKVGDVGRILEVIKVITVMFQSKETKNYANELMRLAYGIRHAWSPQWTKAVVSSWLINTNGKASGWIPADLYQEHNNLLTKTIHSGKESNMSWEMLANQISTNIRLFSKIAKTLESEYDITHNSSFHSTLSAERDIQLIQQSLKDHDILGNARPGDCSVPLVKNLVSEGLEKLIDGRFEKFVEKSVNLGGDEQDAVVVDGLKNEDNQAEEYIRSLFNAGYVL
ncbi:hypothetical protein BC939DRAFT_447007 [Gamsiella multidivaricata]|uniref:uncharacterized protein n=1 Tax=Gamsiella multidivaricata TaxID=101098 RepID=UPI00221E4078|nr:uncharacterized protein BC939DRAFT_447007 [Gamsiella multidivaricata]KAI7826126.1 hypothetical protein BC939DRAFT_447007 [Gamsiella multidivaricata]